MVLGVSALQSGAPPIAQIDGSTLSILHVAGEPGTTQEVGVLLPKTATVRAVTVNGAPHTFTQTGSYVEVPVRFAGGRFAQAQQIPLASDTGSALRGSFAVPQRVFDQLAARRKQWPIPWTDEDYKTTWLAPERLLLYVQLANTSDVATVTATLDGQPLTLTPAYTSIRAVPHCFIGYYADLSTIAPEKTHTIELHAPQLASGQLKGLFFDNVLPQFTESLAH
jgi:hypothetical protein